MALPAPCWRSSRRHTGAQRLITRKGANMELFFWIVALLLIVMGGFTGYMNWKAYFKAKKAKTTFLATHPEAKTVKVGMVRVWIYIAMFVACIGLAIFMATTNPETTGGSQAQLSQVIVYVGLAIFSFAMIGEALMDREVYSVSDGFLYESEFVRYKNIRSITPARGLFKSSFITTVHGSQAQELSVSHKLAQWADEKWEEWKQARKSSHPSRKERRIAARKAREEKLEQTKEKQAKARENKAQKGKKNKSKSIVSQETNQTQETSEDLKGAHGDSVK